MFVQDRVVQFFFIYFVVCPQLSSEDVSASLGEESLQEDREEEPQESQQAPHPAGESYVTKFRLQVTFCFCLHFSLNGYKMNVSGAFYFQALY